MKLSYEWLNEFVDIRDIAPMELAEQLTSVGIAVDGVEIRSDGISGVVVGLVVECIPHPNADRLRVCRVDVGQGELSTIVCGAQNVVAGMKVPTALPGSTLPGMTISKAKLRGIESNGMLCSAKELGLEVKLLPKEQTDGLYQLPDDVAIGCNIVDLLHLDDAILDLDLTPNRSDCLSMRGIAHEVAAIFERPLRFRSLGGDENIRGTWEATSSPLRVELQTPRCARYDAQVLESLQKLPSPLWMQMRLMAMGIRPIDNIVDVTNYVMLEWGQPLHAFDFEEIHQSTIIVRQGSAGERMITLDGDDRPLTADMIVIADVDRAVGIAGVMGALNSEITPKTRRVVVESAMFDAASVRRTGQRLGLRSEAQQRFEKGIDAFAVTGALHRATQLLQELAGAVVLGGPVSVVAVDASVDTIGCPTTVTFSPQRCNQLLGTELPLQQMRRLLERLGFALQESDEVDGTGVQWDVEIPSRRPDIRIEADLIEEVGRLYGLDSLPSTLPSGKSTVGIRNASQVLRKRTREVLIGAGMTEVVTYSITHPSHLDALRVDEASHHRRMIPLLKPMSDERTSMRTHFLPGLAQVAQFNLSRRVDGGQIFEIGRVYWADSLPLAQLPREQTQWAGLWFGEAIAGLGQVVRKYDFYDVKGMIEVWLGAFGWIQETEFQRSTQSWLHPGRSVDVLLRGVCIGSFGEVHPETAQQLAIAGALYAEFDMDLIIGFLSDAWRVTKLPRFPASRRDVAIIVPDAVSIGELLKAAESNSSVATLLESVRVFDVYTGKGVPEGHKSIAVRFTYRAEDRTLTDEEISQAEAEVLRVWEGLGGVLRSS